MPGRTAQAGRVVLAAALIVCRLKMLLGCHRAKSRALLTSKVLAESGRRWKGTQIGPENECSAETDTPLRVSADQACGSGVASWARCRRSLASMLLREEVFTYEAVLCRVTCFHAAEAAGLECLYSQASWAWHKAFGGAHSSPKRPAPRSTRLLNRS